MANGRPEIGRIGIWSTEMRFGDPAAIDTAAVELEELGYPMLWIPGGIDDAVLNDVARILSQTKRLAIGTGIINIWRQQPEDVAAWWKDLSDNHKSRLLLGIGVSHGPLIGDAWGKPVEVTRAWLEKAIAAGLPGESLCVAALGAKMVALAGELTAGVHPYLVTPEHSAIARRIMGPGKLVAPEQGVILESDPAAARELGRQALVHYRNLPNYVNNWKRLGIAEQDIADASDALIDALFAIGGPQQAAARAKAHLDNGADHVCLQVITAGGLDGAKAAWRELAGVVL
jgi:probable F420-dependent oxidoreductase